MTRLRPVLEKSGMPATAPLGRMKKSGSKPADNLPPNGTPPFRPRRVVHAGQPSPSMRESSRMSSPNLVSQRRAVPPPSIQRGSAFIRCADGTAGRSSKRRKRRSSSTDASLLNARLAELSASYSPADFIGLLARRLSLAAPRLGETGFFGVRICCRQRAASCLHHQSPLALVSSQLFWVQLRCSG